MKPFLEPDREFGGPFFADNAVQCSFSTVGHAEQEKYRCTYERRAVIMKYLDPEAEVPVALNWKPAIIVKGAVHCRLCNITDEGRTCVCTLNKKMEGKIFALMWGGKHVFILGCFGKKWTL